MFVETKSYGCGNKDIWMWEQKNMVVGIKNYCCENKYMVVETNTYGCGNKSMVMGTKSYGCGTKKTMIFARKSI
jgi:hypothetical protein